MTQELDAFIHFFLFAVAIVTYLYRARDRADLRPAGLYLALTGLFDAMAALIMFSETLSERFYSNLFLYHLLTPLQYACLAWLYYDHVISATMRRVIRMSVIIYIAVCIVLASTIQPLSDYNSYALLIKYVLLTGLVLYFLRQTLLHPRYMVLQREPMFWISTAILFHSVGNIFLEGMANYLINHMHGHFLQFNSISALLNYLVFILFFVAFWVSKPTLTHARKSTPNE